MRAVRDVQLLVSTTVSNFVLALTLAVTTCNVLKNDFKIPQRCPCFDISSNYM